MDPVVVVTAEGEAIECEGLAKLTLAVRWAPKTLVASTNSRFITPPPDTPNEAVMAASHGKTVPSMVGALSALRLLLLVSVSSQPSAMSVTHCAAQAARRSEEFYQT